MSRINSLLRDAYNLYLRMKLKNKDFSLLCNNCTGSVILQDLGLEFNSPFVGLWLYPSDFIKYAKNIKHYMSCDLAFIEKKEIDYPVALLDDIEIFFHHYKNKEEAKEKWIERTSRINLEDLFFLLVEKDGCTYEDLEEFDKLPYKNMVAFTHKMYPYICASFHIRGFENKGEVEKPYTFKSKRTYKREYDDFDFIGWFNAEN
ncbi:MAG TPA: DUF1919 domain-containing protein [Clostridia bacterium]|nr:DUF1919 domain-containing protein [Clostridia bacterium]